MLDSLDLVNELTISEADFFLTLQLCERPQNLMDEGLKDWKQIYQLARGSGDIRGITFALQNIFSGLNSNGRTPEALVCARRLLTIGHEADDLLVVSHALCNIASVYWVMGNYVSATQAAREAIRNANQLNSKPLLHQFTGPEAIKKMASDLLHSIKHARGELRGGVAHREAMLAIHQQCGDILNVISSMESLGLVHKDLGDIEEALRWFFAALQELENADIPDNRVRFIVRAGLLGNIGVVLTNKGDVKGALEHIEESLNIYSMLSDAFGQISAFGQKGRALLRAWRIAESVDCFEAMLKLARDYDSDSWQQAAHFNLARVYLIEGNRLNAAVHCEIAVLLAREKLGHIGVDLYWLRAALFHPQLEGEADHHVPYTARFIALAYYALDALHREVRGSMPTAVIDRWIDEFEAVMQAILSLPATAPLQVPPIESIGSKLTSQQSIQNALDSIALDSPFVGWIPLDIALYCVESFRAQSFQERLILNTIDLDHKHDQHFVSELAKIEAEIERLQHCPPVVVTGTVSFGEDGKLVKGKSESEASIAKQIKLQNEHIRRCDELVAARDLLAQKTIESFDAPISPLQVPVRLTDICDVLSNEELFLEFVLLGQSDEGRLSRNEIVQQLAVARPACAYVIAITRSWMDIVPLGPTSALEAQCNKLLDMLDRFGELLSLPFFQSEAALAFDLLLRPVWVRAGTAMKSVRHLVIATDGVLNKFPLDLLIDEQCDASSWRNVQFIARRFSTEYTPSATVFVDLRNGRYRRGEPGRTFVGFGDPVYSTSWEPEPLDELPGTRRELESIAELIRGTKDKAMFEQVRLFMDVDARKNDLSNPAVLMEAEYIHLACHGSAGKEPYVDGALYLTQAEGIEPFQCVLTTREVMDLRTSAKLVVMSACESGLGSMARGEGIQGLVRAWIFSGAQAVIASLWEVDDEATAEIMTSLYRASFTTGISISDSLSAAKRAALDDERLACPVFWAAFNLFGGRAGESTNSHRTAAFSESATSLDYLGHAYKVQDGIGYRERELLGECASAWEAAWNTGKHDIFLAFYVASTELASSLERTTGAPHQLLRPILVNRVARNCRVAWEHWTKQRQAAAAVRAYQAYVRWEPSAKSDEWEVLVSAYRPENLHTLRNLVKKGMLSYAFEMQVDSSLSISLTTVVSWTDIEAETSGFSGHCVEVAIPVDPSFVSKSDNFEFCRDLGWVVFPLRCGETFRLTEQISNCVHVLEDNTFLMGDTWGSTVIPHLLTIRFHPDFVPLRLQRQRMGKASSVASVKFSREGAIVTLRPLQRPWLERMALMFRKVPGASTMLAAPNSPFLEDTEFGHFERLSQEAQRQNQ
jgi:CHAT domain-containing protein/tetratricopeptide (TPR) repeat protein